MKVRRLLFASALYVLAAAAVASAQTVIVLNAPAGSTAELVLNSTTVATGTVGADGLATLTADQDALGGRTSIDVAIWVDRCGTVRRVIVVDRVLNPPPAGGECTRAAIPGLFLLQRITSMVINVERDPPMLRVRQGPVPAEWLLPPEQVAAARQIPLVPSGLILFGGGGREFFGHFADRHCGNVPGCDDERSAFAGVGGVAVWPTRYFGFEASLLRPARMTAAGSGEGFRFDSEMEGGTLLFAGKVGAPLGRRLRLFGMGGMNRHRFTFTTIQTINENAQTLQWRSEGWGPAFGGGLEVWASSRLGFYGEAFRLSVKGEDTRGSEARIDAAMVGIVGGLRLRLFGE